MARLSLIAEACICLLSTLGLALAPLEATTAPKGYFVFRSAEGGINLETPWMHSPNISGPVLRDTWASIEAKQGTYNFSRLETALKRTKELGKVAQLEILAGPKSPAWTGGETAQYSEKFIADYEAMAAAAGAKLNGYPIVAVHCTLPSSGSAEFSSPPAALTKPGWQKQALAANKRAILALAHAFPSSTIVVDLHNPTGAGDGFVDAQIQQLRATLGTRGAIQENAFNSKSSQTNYNLYKAVQVNVAQGYPAGYEQVSDSSVTGRYGTAGFDASLKYLGKAQWLIVYDKDFPKIKAPFGK